MAGTPLSFNSVCSMTGVINFLRSGQPPLPWLLQMRVLLAVMGRKIDWTVDLDEPVSSFPLWKPLKVRVNCLCCALSFAMGRVCALLCTVSPAPSCFALNFDLALFFLLCRGCP